LDEHRSIVHAKYIQLHPVNMPQAQQLRLAVAYCFRVHANQLLFDITDTLFILKSLLFIDMP